VHPLKGREEFIRIGHVESYTIVSQEKNAVVLFLRFAELDFRRSAVCADLHSGLVWRRALSSWQRPKAGVDEGAKA
jgi:hypothetical protein